MTALNRFHLNGLRALEVVGRLGTLSRAAEELGISPGAVSQQIIKAEKQLGHQVFQRTPAGLKPTPFGIMLLKHLATGFRALEAAASVVDESDTKVLRVSTTPVFASKWLVPRLPDFQAENPGIWVQVDTRLELVDLARADIDVAIRTGRGNWPGTRADLLLSQYVYPVCSPSYASKLGKPSDLFDAAILRNENASEQWEDWLALYDLARKPLPEGMVFSESSLCIDAAASGLGVALGWQLSAGDMLKDGRLVRPFKGAYATGLGVWFVTSEARSTGRKLGALKAWLKRELALLPDGLSE